MSLDRVAEAIVIRGALRDYDWGIRNGLSDWTGVSTDGPEAELWFGAHLAAPSPVVRLDRSIATNLADELTAEQVPLLTKILAAASPLSLQVHPAAAMARRWRETEEGRRLLPDNVAKAEMLIALEEFVVLVGWRSTTDSEAILRAVGASERVRSAVLDGDHATAIGLLLGEDQIAEEADVWIAAVRSTETDQTTQEAMSQVASKFPGDPGIAVAVLLQSQILAEGDAVYLPVGVPHAYVQGRGVEVMTNSDDVLRMGLTSKVVSVEHAVAALNPELSETLIRVPSDGNYSPPDAPFSVRFCGNESVVAAGGDYRLALVLTGGLEADVSGESRSLEVGEALVMPADCPETQLNFVGRGVLVTATGFGSGGRLHEH